MMHDIIIYNLPLTDVMSNEYQTRAERIFEHMKNTAETGGYNTDAFKDPNYKSIIVTHIAANLESVGCDGALQGMSEATRSWSKLRI